MLLGFILAAIVYFTGVNC